MSFLRRLGVLGAVSLLAFVAGCGETVIDGVEDREDASEATSRNRLTSKITLGRLSIRPKG